MLVTANLMAVLVQYQSARLGLVTGRTLPELVGDRLLRRAITLVPALALVALVRLSGDPAVMGTAAIRRAPLWAMGGVAGVVTTLNVVLIGLTVAGA